jgi:hypothetical protein
LRREYSLPEADAFFLGREHGGADLALGFCWHAFGFERRRQTLLYVSHVAQASATS